MRTRWKFLSCALGKVSSLLGLLFIGSLFAAAWLEAAERESEDQNATSSVFGSQVPYPYRPDLLVAQFARPGQPITSVAFSPDGRFALTGSWFGKARLWDIATAEEVSLFEGHSDRVTSVAFSPDGRFVLTGSWDKTARLWDRAMRKEVRRFEGDSDKVTSVAFSPDGRFALTGSSDGIARLWDTATAKEVQRFEGHSKGVSSVAFCPEGRFVLTGSYDKTACLWDTATGKEVRRFDGNSDEVSVYSVAFSPDCRFALTGSSDGIARLWDTATGKRIHPFEQHSYSVNSVAFSPDGRLVLTGSSDKTARLWDAATGKEVRRFQGNSDEVNSVAFSPDGRLVLTGSVDGTGRLWNAVSFEDGEELDSNRKAASQPKLTFQRGHTGNIVKVAVSTNSRYVTTASEDKFACLWDAQSGAMVQCFEHPGEVKSVDFSPDSSYLLTASRGVDPLSPRKSVLDNAAVYLWNLKTGMVTPLAGQWGWVHAASFSPSGSIILVASNDGVVLLDAKTGKEVSRFECLFESGPHECGAVQHVAFSYDGRYVVGGGNLFDEGIVWVWRTDDGKQISAFKAHDFSVWSVAFSPDANHIITGGGDGTAKLWETWSRRLVHTFDKHGESPVLAVAYSPDGRYVVTGSADDQARLWDTAEGNLVRIFKGHIGGVFAVTFFPQGEYILTGGKDTIARVWDVASGREKRRFASFTSDVHSVAFSPNNNNFLLTGSEDTMAHLWDLRSGGEIRRFEGHKLYVTSVTFSPDGRFVLTGGLDSLVRLWDFETGTSVWSTKEDGGHVTSVACCQGNDSRFAAVGGLNLHPRVWDLDRYENKPRMFERAAGAGRGAWSLVALSKDCKRLLAAYGREIDQQIEEDNPGDVRVWDLMTGKEEQALEHAAGDNITSVAMSGNGQYVIAGRIDGSAQMWNADTGRLIRQFPKHEAPVDAVAFSQDVGHVFTADSEGVGRSYKVGDDSEPQLFKGHDYMVTSGTFSSDGRFVATAGSADRTTRVWNADSGRELARLVSLTDGTWLVVTPDGRFDTSNLEEIKGLYWIMPDDPMRPLPVEIFMRDYYEPRLLPRVLKGEQFKPIRPLADRNRVQPGVKILKVEQGASPDIAKVTVEVSAAEGSFQRDGKDVVMKTRVHDLRLYRNGQLVGQWPEAGELTYKSLNTTSKEELNAWRKATEIAVDQSGKATKTFTVRLPRREDLKEVAFSAYAFNLDRVKSETARQTYTVPTELKTVPGRAYLITVGVSGNEDMTWRLSFASEDAKLVQRTVAKQLKDSGRYEKVVPACLITTPPGSVDPEAQAVCGESIQPTKENIKTVLDILAGRKVEQPRLEQLPQGLRSELRRIQPEDLVLLSFSSHGVMDANGEFYLLPYDLGMDSAGKVIPELLKRSISSQELSLWLAPVDAEQLMMVVDACHSAAAVEAEGFKPGPMGNPGLGQLSYDKGMPILVASQASESAGALRCSLLTLTLAEEGIEEQQMGLNDALRYAEQRVPKLYEEKMGKEEKKKIQEPKLFEFRR